MTFISLRILNRMKGLKVKQKRIITTVFAVLVWVMAVASLSAQDIQSPLPSLREQAAIQQEWLKIRLERVLPALMREHHIAMWIVSMREYNEDPVFSSLASATTFAARRRTIYVFVNHGETRGVERLALGGSSQGGLYTAFRDTSLKGAELWGEGQWKLLAKLVADRDPANIAVDISSTHAFSDGLSASEWEQLQNALGPEYTKRVIRAERLPLDYIATRIPEMLPMYRSLMETAHAIIAEAFSNRVITPGKTTAEDVVWWMRQRLQELGMTTWFQPSVDVQRNGTIPVQELNPVIERGDVLHCDFGVTAMRLNTDTQHLGYVLRDGETDVPAGLKAVLAKSNRLQDIVLETMAVGKSGDQVLAESLAKMKSEGIDGSIYSHPVGEHGHAAGPVIGLWDRQTGVPGRGEVPIIRNSWFSVELQAGAPVVEWGGKIVRTPQEEDVQVDADGKVSWILQRQTKFYLIG